MNGLWQELRTRNVRREEQRSYMLCCFVVVVALLSSSIFPRMCSERQAVKAVKTVELSEFQFSISAEKTKKSIERGL